MSRRSCMAQWIAATLVMLAVTLLFQAGALAGVVEQAQVQYDKGLALMGQAKLAEAVSEWRKSDADFSEAAKTDPHVRAINAAALTGLADALRQQEKPDEAIAAASDVLARFPQFRSQCADAMVCIAKAYQAKGDLVNAVRFYKDVLKSYPDKITRSGFARTRMETLLNKGTVLPAAEQADLDVARARHDAAAREDEQITTARREAWAKADAGAVETGKAELLALYNNPAVQNSHARLRMLGLAQLNIRDRANARITFNRLLAVAADEFMPEDYAAMRVTVHHDLGDLSAAISEGEQAIAKYPNGSKTCGMRYYVAICYDEMNQADKCLDAYGSFISDYDSATDLDTRFMMSTALARSGARLAELGSKTEAAAMFQRAITDYADTPMSQSAANSLRDLQEGRK